MIKINDIWKLWHDHEFEIFLKDIITNINDIELVILDCLNEVEYVENLNKQLLQDLLKLTEKNHVPVIFLTPKVDDFAFTYTNVKIIRWQTFYFFKNLYLWSYPKHQELNKQKNLDIYDPDVCLHGEFKYPYICLNNIVKAHRCIIMDLLCKYDLLDKGAVSWRGVDRGVEPYNYDWKYWSPKKIFLDQDSAEGNFLQETLPLELHNSFINLVTESDDTITFLSEKTTVPLLFNKIFLVFSSQYFHRDLKRLGFKLYDELFDYSFDEEPDLYKRAEMLLENIKVYSQTSPSELREKYLMVLDKIKWNRELAFKFANEIPSEIDALKRKLVEKNVEYTGPLNIVWYNKSKKDNK